MIAVRKLVGLTFILLSLAACQQNTAKATPETRPAIRAANGTLYDLKCLKGNKPGSMAACAVDTSKSAVRRAYSDVDQKWYQIATDTTYFIWQLPYFDESSMCQWMWGMPSCYSYFGTQAIQGPNCQVGWLFQYQDLPQTQARNCGNWWNPWYTPPSQGNWGGWPWWNQPWPQDPWQQPTLSCADIKAERDWQASQAAYCNQDSQCEVLYSQAKWGSCNPPATNQWLHTQELDYWTDEYEYQCLNGTAAPTCAQTLVACPAPKCVAGRCSQTCP